MHEDGIRVLFNPGSKTLNVLIRYKTVELVIFFIQVFQCRIKFTPRP